MAFKPIEGVDYIFDRYAYLGLELGASKKDIQKALRQKRAEAHPDRLLGAGDDIKQLADYLRTRADECADVLQNDDLRPLYDARLRKFYDEKPRLVSKDGRAIIDVQEEHFSIDSLLSEDVPDTAHLEQKVRELTQFDDAVFENTQKLYQSMPENGQARKIYKDALTQKLVYLEVLEDVAWKKVGYSVKKSKTAGLVLYAEDYKEHVEEELKRVSGTVIKESIYERNEALRIGTAEPPLLLEDFSKVSGSTNKKKLPSTLDQKTMKKLIGTARKNLEIRADYVREIAQEKQDVLKKLVTFADVLKLSKSNPGNPHHEIYMVTRNSDGEFNAVAKFNLDTTQKTMSSDEGFQSAMSLKDANKQVSAENAVAVIINPEISSMMIEITHVADMLMEKVEQTPNFSPCSKPKPNPAP